MSAPSFRTRNLDGNRAVYVYRYDEEPLEEELLQLTSCGPSIPTGMEKDEENEHHLQRALAAQQQFGTAKATQIPIPKITDIGSTYDKFYPAQHDVPKTLVHLQLISDESDIPSYDMDVEDEAFYVDKVKRFHDISRVDFEYILTKLEENSGHLNVISIDASMMLLKMPRDLVKIVYYYWISKRERLGHPLLLQIASAKESTNASSAASTTANPYIAFRKRVEKMQTRKNRKNDEIYYQKMFKLRKEFDKALRLFYLLKNRENLKHQLVNNLIMTYCEMLRVEDFQHVLSNYDKMSRKIIPHSPISSCPKRQSVSNTSDDFLPDEQIIGMLPPRLITKTVFRQVRPLPPKDSIDCEYTFQRRRGCRYRIPLRNFNEPEESVIHIPSRFKRPLNYQESILGKNMRIDYVQSGMKVHHATDLSSDVDDFNFSILSFIDGVADKLDADLIRYS